MLVAKHFVPNPNGYRHIRYKDGDTSNSIYTNIEWIKSNIPEDRRGRPPRKHYSREEQIALMERQIHYLEKAVEYLKEEKVAEIVYEMYVPYLVKYACRRFGKHDILEEEFISYATDYLIGKLSRGVPVYCINTLFDRLAAQFFAQKALSGGIKAVKFNDAINYKNDAI
jgi:hypothetical protein